MTECLFSVEGRRRLIDTRNTYAPHIQLHRAPCLIFLSSRVNIWHKEALDSARGRFKPDTGWGKRGDMKEALHGSNRPLGSSFKQPVPSSYTHTHTHGHTLLGHTLRLRCTNMHVYTKNTPLKTTCKMFSVATHTS